MGCCKAPRCGEGSRPRCCAVPFSSPITVHPAKGQFVARLWHEPYYRWRRATLRSTILLGPIEPRAESLASPWRASVTATASLYWLDGHRRGSMAVSGFDLILEFHPQALPQALPHSRFDIRPMSGRRAKFPDSCRKLHLRPCRWMAALGSMHLRRTRVSHRHRQSVHVKTIGPAADEPAWMPCARRCSSAGGVALTAAQVAKDDATPSFLRLVVSCPRQSLLFAASRD